MITLPAQPESLSRLTLRCNRRNRGFGWVVYKRQRSSSRLTKGEQAIWQRQFWEHQIRDDRDFAQPVDYIHYNPVSHGLVAAPRDWRYSSFHRYVREGIYPEDWGADRQVIVDSGVGGE